jgi:glycosyltransferase involved in cell wall biosynthesis
VLCLGKTSMDWKGTNTLCEALKSVDGNPTLVMFGRETNPEDSYPISYYMNPDDEQLAQIYRDCDIAVCPSWYESFPAPPLEAMSSGTPCVTTATGTEDYCVDGWNSLVVPACDPEAMAAAINRLLSDHELYAKLVANGLETAKKFSWDITADKVEMVFLEALDD